MPYNKNQIELDRTISTLVLKTSMLMFEETELYLESNEKSNKKDFHNNLENHSEVILNRLKSVLDLRDVLIKDINKSETIEIIENSTFENIFIEYNPENFNHFCIDNIDFELLQLEFQYLYCQFRITIDYSIENSVVISLNFDDKSLLHFIKYYLSAIERDFLKDLAIDDIKEMIPPYVYTENEYNDMVESGLWEMNIATMFYTNTDNMKITNEKLSKCNVNDINNLEYSEILNNSKYNSSKKNIKTITHKELEKLHEKALADGKTKSIGRCRHCFRENNYITIEDNLKGKQYLYQFCYFCGYIYIYEKGLFGFKKKPFAHSSLSKLAAYGNMVRDAVHNDETFKFVITNRAQVPYQLTNFLFEKGLLLIDDNGLKTRDNSYTDNIHFYSESFPEEIIIAEKLDERHEMKRKNKRESARINRGEFESNEIPWITVN